MLRENKKVGLMPSNNHITCSESKVAHQRISIHLSFKNNVKVKVMLHFVLSALRPYVSFLASLIFVYPLQ